MTAHPDILAIGQHIGSYRVDHKLGAGGMGAVYAATHTGIGRRVAIKVLHPRYAGDPELSRRFLDEARAVNLISHPNVVDVTDLGQLPDGTAYLVMEYLVGQPLSTRMRWSGGRLGHATLRFARQIASALAAAHARGIVHRDLKPDNVMIVGDPEMPAGERVKVLDFGIAKLADAGDATGAAFRPAHTRRASIMGTPTYMAPEQCRGAETVDHKADVYALGVILYQLLAGRPPFVARTLPEMLGMHQFVEPVPLTALTGDLDPRLSALVHAMLAKDHAARPDMRQAAAVLDGLATGHAPAPAPAPPDRDARTPAPEPTLPDRDPRRPRDDRDALPPATPEVRPSWPQDGRHPTPPVRDPYRPARAPEPAPRVRALTVVLLVVAALAIAGVGAVTALLLAR